MTRFLAIDRDALRFRLCFGRLWQRDRQDAVLERRRDFVFVNVVDRNAAPVAGAAVTANVHGAAVEIFNSATTLTDFPALDGRTPDRQAR